MSAQRYSGNATLALSTRFDVIPGPDYLQGQFLRLFLLRTRTDRMIPYVAVDRCSLTKRRLVAVFPMPTALKASFHAQEYVRALSFGGAKPSRLVLSARWWSQIYLGGEDVGWRVGTDPVCKHCAVGES